MVVVQSLVGESLVEGDYSMQCDMHGGWVGGLTHAAIALH